MAHPAPQQDASHAPSPSKRSRTKPPPPPPLPSTSTATGADGFPPPPPPADLSTLAGGAGGSAKLSEKAREQLRVVVESLAPPTVLEQQLSGVPGWEGKTLRDVLGTKPEGEGGLEVGVVRAALSSSSTSALLASTLSFNFDDSGEASAKLLNEIDEFQRTVGGVLDGLERRGEARGVKREADDEDPQPASKSRKYMLHRSLSTMTGVDLFTSGAILSEGEVQELAKLEDTDLVLLQSLPTFTSTSSITSTNPPAPSLGSTLPPPLPPSSLFPSPPYSPYTNPQPALARFGLTPGQVAQRAKLLAFKASGRTDVADASEAEGEEKAPGEVELLYYGPFSSFAPSFDSREAFGSRGTYGTTASRALREKRGRRWESEVLCAPALLPALGASGGEVELSEAERQALRDLGVQDLEACEAALRVRQGEVENWKRLDEVARLIERVGGRQVARISAAARKRGRAGERKGEGVKAEGEQAGEEQAGEEQAGGGVRVEGAEREEAQTLLSLLSSLISLHSQSSSSPSSNNPSTTSSSPTSRIVPPPAVFSTFTPLYLSSSAREASYYGTLDEVNYRAVRESVLESHIQGGAGGGGVNGAGEEMQV